MTCAATGHLARAYAAKDPSEVVSDEVCGYLIAAATPFDAPFIWKAVGAFSLFRLFDIWKPGPIRRLEALPGGLGVVADDAAAGVLANLCLSAAILVWRAAA